MAKQRFVYRPDHTGKILALQIERLETRHGKEADTFDDRIKQTLHQQECEHGSRFRVPGFSPSQLKRAWERDPIGP